VAGIGLPAEILERRPDVRAAKERLAAATAAIGVAEAARLPTVYVSGQFYIASNTVSGLGDLANKAYSIGPSLYLPLLDGGRIDSAVRQQRALAEAALAQYRQAMVTAIGDVSAGVGDFVHARESRRLADAAMESARSALVLANQQFDAGVIDFSTLLDVQRSALDAESSAVEARAGLVQGFVSLQRALGAGWSGDEPLVAQGEGRGETSVEHDRAGATGAGEENR
jgi:outer membrane protein TolC